MIKSDLSGLFVYDSTDDTITDDEIPEKKVACTDLKTINLFGIAFLCLLQICFIVSFVCLSLFYSLYFIIFLVFSIIQCILIASIVNLSFN